MCVRDVEVKGNVSVHKVCIFQGPSIWIIHGFRQIQVPVQEDKRHVQASLPPGWHNLQCGTRLVGHNLILCAWPPSQVDLQ